MGSHEIVKFLESIGAEFGACQNAYTSADETVYELMLPSETGLGFLDDCLDVLSQFAFSIRCSKEDLDKERGAVMEEWRMSQDASGRASQSHWKMIMKGSKYADRLPIGLPSVIRGVSATKIKSFYHRHYHPSRMAVCIVGDFPSQTQSVLDLLMASSLSTAPERLVNARPPKDLCHSFIPHFQPRVSILVDSESSQSSIYLSFKFVKKKKDWSCQDLLESIAANLMEFCLSSRLFKLSRLQDPPFASASVSTSDPLTATTSVRTLSAVLIENSVGDDINPALRALECLLTEVARVRLHGFEQEEFDRALKRMKSEISNTWKERDEGHASDIRDEYLRNFLSNEIVLGQDLEARLYKTLFPMIKKEQIEAFAQRFKTSDSCVIKILEHQKTVSEEDVRRLMDRVDFKEKQNLIAPFQHSDAVPEHLIPPSSLPSHGAISFQETRDGSLGLITEMKLENGMRICFKPSDLSADEVLISGFAFSGLSDIPPELFNTASLTTSIARQLGALGLKPSVLQDILSGKRVSLDIHQSAFLRYFKGSSTPGDLLEAFQLLHLLFTSSIQYDEEELAVVMRLVRQNLEAQIRSPQYEYSNRVKLLNYGECYYWRPITLEDVDEIDLPLACAFHNISFRNPAEFTLVITGNVSLDVLSPLISQYLASIPSTSLPPPKSIHQVTALPHVFPIKPVVEDVLVIMKEDITSQQITIPVCLRRQTARELLVWLSIGVRIIESRLLQRMRFEFGDVYTVQVSSFFGCDAPSNKGDVKGDIAISFTCCPKNRDRLAEIALTEMDCILSDPSLAESADAQPINQTELDTAALLEDLAYREAEGEMSHWHGIIYMSYQSKSFEELGSVDAVYDKNKEARKAVWSTLKPQAMYEALSSILPPPRSQYTIVRMVPKTRPMIVTPFLYAGLFLSIGLTAFFFARRQSIRFWPVINSVRAEFQV